MCVCAAPAQAGQGAWNWLIVYDPSDGGGVTLAQHYAEVRGFPETHLVPYAFPKLAQDGSAINHRLSRADTWAFIQHLRDHIAKEGLDGQINGVTLVGLAPTQMIPEGNAVPSVSLTTALMMAPGAVSAAALEERAVTHRPAIFRGPDNGTFLEFRETTEIRGDLDYAGERYWLATHLAYTGLQGLSLDEAMSSLDRTVATDGTDPEGTVYWPLNNDIRSTERAPFIEWVTPEWDGLDIRYRVEGLGEGGVNPPRVLPLDKSGAPGSDPTEQVARGMVVGQAQIDLPASGTLLGAGSLAEHLTSFGGAFGGSFTSGQTPATEWLRGGAAGSSGTVSEPFLTWTKFPHPRLHSHYARGASLAEAFAQSIQAPVQTLVLGDPLARPYADIPELILSGPADGNTVSGNVTLTYTVASGRAVEPLADLLVDGRRVAIGAAGEPVDAVRLASGFEIDTQTLPDGPVRVSVVVYGADAIRTQGIVNRDLVVSNVGASLVLNAPSEVLSNASFNAVVTPSGLPTATDRIELRFLGQTLGSLPPGGGTVSVAASQLGLLGESVLVAEAVDASGKVLCRSEAARVAVSPVAEASSPERVTRPGMLALMRVFEDASQPGFDWSGSADGVFALDDQFDFAFDAGESFPVLGEGAVSPRGVEFVTVFTARETGFYDFAFKAFDTFSFLLNGVPVITDADAGNTPIHARRYLAAGKHELRFRLKFTGGDGVFEAGFRAGYTRNRSATGPELFGHDFFDLTHCAAPASAVEAPSLSATVPAAGSVTLDWSGGWSGPVGEWVLERFSVAPAVSLNAYLGSSQSPEIVPAVSLRSLRPGAPVALDGERSYMMVPEAYRYATRLMVDDADRADRGRNILYRVDVTAGTSVLALIDAASDTAQPNWMAGQHGWTLVGQESTSELSSNWRTWKFGPVASDTTLDLGGHRRNDGAITFLFLKDLQWNAIARLDGAITGTTVTGQGSDPVLYRVRSEGVNGYSRASDPLQVDPAVVGAQLSSVALPLEIEARLPAGAVELGARIDGGGPFQWSLISGPGGVVFADPTDPATTAAFSQPGVYQLRLTAGSGTETRSAETSVTVLPAVASNVAPVVSAGSNRSLHVAETITLNGSVTDDGSTNGGLSLHWEQISGPGIVTFQSPEAAQSLVYFSAPGTYTLSLAADDGLGPVSDSTTITVAPDPNAPPSVELGADRELLINLSNSLAATVNDDGMPNPPGSLSYLWRQISGPGTVSFDSLNAAATAVTFSEIGTYEIELRVDDGARFGTDRIVADVRFDDDGNQPPSNDAGADLEVVLPGIVFTDGASASDDGLPSPPGGLAHSWEQVSGPGTLVYQLVNGGPSALFRLSLPGEYTLRLVSSDGAAAAADTIEVSVLESSEYGKVYAWGGNARGQLGLLGTVSPVLVPELLDRNWRGISTSNQFSLAIAPDGTVLGAGRSALGQLGDEAGGDRTWFAPIAGLTSVIEVHAGVSFGAALDSSGYIWTWGSNGNGQLGDGTTTANSTPRVVSGLLEVASFGADDDHVLAVLSDGTVRGWGRNNGGQLGDGSSERRTSPVAMTGVSGAVATDVGRDHSLVLLGDGTVLASGLNFDGQLGDGGTADRAFAAPVSGLQNVVAVAAGDGHSLALIVDGTVRAWGSNSLGQIGDGSTTDRTLPVAVSGLSEIVAIDASGSTSAAVHRDGRLFVWGSGFNGQFGDGATPTSRSLPESVPELNKIGILAIGYGSVLALERGQLYSEFVEAAFTPVEQADVTVSGPEVDVEGDRLENIFEYYFVTDPKLTDVSPIRLALAPDGRPSLTLRHRMIPEGIEAQWYQSGNLIQWDPVEPEVVSERDLGDLVERELRFEEPGIGSAVFFRLELTLLP